MMNFNKKTITLLGIAIAVTLAVGGVYAFLFIAMRDKTLATTPLLEKADELSGRESRIAASLSILRRENANIEKLSAYFFKGSEVVEFTRKVEALAAQSGTRLTLESLEQGYAEKSVPYLNFRINATGRFVDIERLLLLLESFPGKLEWKSINLALGGETTEPSVSTSAPLWTINISLVARNFIN